MTKQDKPTMKIEKIAELMHNIYEDKAREFGWSTQDKTRVPFNDLPESNRKTMLAVAEVVISTIRREAVEGFMQTIKTDAPDFYSEYVDYLLKHKDAYLNSVKENKQ